jgi:hypothetical protein
MNSFTVPETMMQAKIFRRVIIDYTRFIVLSLPVDCGRICGGHCYPRSPIVARCLRNYRNDTKDTDWHQN